MKPLAMRAFLLVFLAIVAGVQSGPISLDDDTCATTCTESSKFGYSVGQMYSFLYEADTVTSLQGATEEHSSLHIKATAQIHVLSQCELALTLSDVTLEESDPTDLSRRTISENSRQFKRAVEANPIKFSFQDGHIDAVCADSQDPTWVVNMKRGIISGMQNTMDSLEQNHKGSETDVAGVCDAEYKVAKRAWGGKTTVTKSKDLLACTDRHGHFSSMQATPYKLSSDIQSLPLLKGTHECDQTISKQGIMERSEIRESHTFRPFSTQESGATTTTRQLLTFQNQAPVQRVRFGSTRRTDLLYEHTDREATMEQNADQVTEVLREICELEDVRPETPRLYSRLVYALRKVDAYTMKNLHAQVERENVCQKNSLMAKEFFHDAIPSVSTAASASLMRELIENGEIKKEEADMWLTSLAFVAQPSSDMIREVSPLLQGSNPTRKMYLSISTLVHSYCRQNQDCEFNQDIQQVLNAITANLGYNCRDSEEEKVIMSLKALGNTGMAVQAVPILGRCLSNNELSMEIRVTAVEAFNRMPCENREELMNAFLNADEDSELRIKAYVALMQCPSEDTIYKVKNMLSNEEVNQVGSFVWTHMTNLKETSDIFKQEIREILEDAELQQEFNLDARKFSRNYEASMFMDSINAGAKVESNMIWSPKSFVPRSAMVNLTVDMFGHSINFLELGGRVEGAEDFLQKMFGPDGYFPAEKRDKRSISADDKLRETNRADPKAAMYMKMFGNELRYWDLSDFTNVEKEDFNILDLLIKLAQEHEVEWSRSAMFLDSELTVPTALGMPLRLTVNGTATVDVKIGGKVDVRQIAVYPNSMDINGYVKPSGAIEVSSVMGLDAFVARTGLKMVTTLHTSTEVDGFVKLDESHVITAKFNMPKEKMEVLNVKTQFFIVHKEEDREQQMITENRVDISRCSGKKLENALGLRFCADVSYPSSDKADAPFFPFTGPITASIDMHKVDDHKAYEFEARLETTKEKGAINRLARVSFNTPGSSVDRKIFAEVTIDSANQKVSANLMTPWKQASIDGSIVNKRELKSARLEVTMDKQPAFSVLSELQVDSRPKAAKVSPNVEVLYRNKPVLTLKGDAKYVYGDMLDMDLVLDSKILNSPITVKGGVDSTSNNNKNRWNTDITFRSQFLNTKVAGFTQTKDGLVSSRMEFRYDYNDGSKHQFIVNGKMKDMSKNKLTKYSANTAITSTEFPDYNVEMDIDVSKNPKSLQTNVDLHYGQDAKDNKKRIIFSQDLDYSGNLKSFDVNHVAKLKWKALELDLQSKLSHSHTLYKDLTTQARFSYSPSKDISLNVNLKNDQADLLKMSGDVVLAIPGREMRVFKSLEQKAKNEFNSEAIVQWQKGGQVRSSAVYSRIPTEKRHEITAELYGPVGKPTVVSGSTTLKIDDFSAKAQVAHRGNTYRTEASYDYTMAQKKSANGKLDIIYPSRHITFETSAASASGEHNIAIKSMWDADNDVSQKFNLGGVVSMKTGSHEGDLKITVPSRTISVSFNNKYDGQNFQSSADLSWAPQQTISIASSGSFEITSFSQKIQGTMQVSTPFYADQVKMNLNHRFNRRRLENQVDITYAAGQTVSTDVSVQILDGLRSMENKVIISLPIRGYKKLSLQESHSLTANAFTGHLEGGLNSDLVAMDVAGQLKGASVEATLSLATPYDVARKASVSWKHNMEGNTLSANAEASVNRQKVIFELTNSFDQSSFSTKATIQSTFRTVRNAELEATFSSNARSAQGNMMIKHNDEQIFVLLGEGKVAKDMEGKLQIQSIIPGMEDLSTMFFLKKSQAPQTAHVEFKWAENKVIAIDGEVTSARYENVNGQLRFTSPFQAFERLVFNHEHSYIQGELKTNSNFEYAPRKIVELVTSFSNSQALAVSFKLDTPCSYLQTLSASVNHAGYATSFNNKVTAQYRSRYSTVDYNNFLTVRGASHVVGNAELSSSLFSDVAISVDHQQVAKEFVSKMSLSFMEREKVALEFHFENAATMKASAELTTSFPEVPFFVIKASHQGQGAYFVNVISIQSQIKRSQVNFDSNIRINGASSQDISLQLTTPFENFEDLAFALKHSFDGDNMNCHCEVKLDARRSIVLDNKMSFARGFSINTDIQTPFRTFRSLLLDLDHNGGLARFRNKASLQVVSMDGPSKFESSLNIAGLRSINGKVTLKTPFRQLQNFETNIEHGLRGAVWATNFDMTLPTSDRYEITSQVNVEEINADITIKTPFSDDIHFTASHKTQRGEQVLQGTLGFAPSKTIEAEFRFDNSNALKMSTSLETPFQVIRHFDAMLEHTGPWNNFVTKMEINKDTLRMASEALFRFDYTNMDAKFTLEAPRMRNLEITVSHNEQSYKRYECAASGKYGAQEIRATANINAQSMEQFGADLALFTPFVVARQVSLSVQHNGDLMQFNNQIELSHNGDKSTYEGSFDATRAVTGDFKFTSQYKPVEFLQAKFNSNGMRRNSIELSYAQNKKIEASFVINMRNGFHADAEFSAPFSQPIKVAINCEGMTHTTEVSYGRQTVSLSAEATLSPLAAKVTFTSPFEAVRNFELALKGTGSDIGEFTAETTFAHNDKQVFDFRADFFARDTIRGKFDWTSSFKNVEALSVEFNHEGNYEDFTTSGMFSYAPSKKIAFQAKMKMNPTIEGHFNFETPCRYIENLNINFAHSGNLGNFECSGDLSYNNEKLGEGQLSFSSDRFNVGGDMKLNAVFIDLEANFNHKSNRKLVETEGKIIYNGKTISGKATVATIPTIEVSLELQSPCQYARDLSLKMKHEADSNTITNSLKMTHDRYGRISTDASIKLQPFEVQVSAKTPIASMRTLSLNVKSNNNIRTFDGSINLEKNGDKFISAESNWETIGKLEGTFKLWTIFDAVKNVEAYIKHEGNLQRFNDFLDIRHNGNLVFHTETDFTLTPLKGSFSVETPATAFRSLKTAFSHEGTARQFRTHAEVTHNTNNQFMADVAFESNPAIKTTFQITTPFQALESVSIKVNHQGDVSAFQSSAEMTLNSKDKYGAQAQFTMEPAIDGTLSISTPIRNWRNINAGFRFAGDKEAMNGRAEIRSETTEFLVDGSFQARPLEGKITIKTPFANYEDLSAEISHKGNMKKAFKSRAVVAYQTGKQVELDVEFKNYGRMIASVEVKTPFPSYQEMGMTLKHSMENDIVESSAILNLGNKKATADINMKLSSNFEGSLEINTPIRGYRKMRASINHQMTPNSLDSKAEVTYANGKTISASANGQFNSINNMQGAAEINTPFYGYESMKMSGNHGITPTIKTAFEMSLNENKFEAEFDMANTEDIQGSLTIHTPFRGYEELTASFDHAGNAKRFNTRAAIKYAEGKVIEASAEFDANTNIDAVFKFNCPCKYVNIVGAEFHLKGDMTNYKVNGKVYQDSNEITVDNKYASRNGVPTLVTLEITSPFSEDITLEMTNDYKTNGQFQTAGSLAWSPRQKINVRSSGTLRGSISELLLNGNLQIFTPFRAFNQMEINTEHQHSLNAVNTKVDVDFNRQKVLDTEVQYGKASGKVEMRVPYTASAIVDTTGDLSDFTSNVELALDQDNSVKFQVSHKDQSSYSGFQREFSIKTITAFRTMSFSTDIVKNAYTFTNNAAFSWDEARQKTVSYKINFNDRSRRNKHQYSLETRLDTPIRSAEFTINHNDDSETYNTEANIMWDAARDQGRKLTMVNVYSKYGNSHKNELSISHPAMQKPMVMRTEFELNNAGVLFSGHSEVDCFESPLVLDARLENKASGYGAFNYTVTFGISHPASTIDIQTVAHAANTETDMTSGVTINYLSARRQAVSMALQAQINKIKKSLNIQLDTPMKKAEISGDMTPNYSGKGFAINMAAESEGKALTGRLEASCERHHEFDFKVFYSPENEADVMHVTGKYLSPTSMMMEAYRMHNGQKITESTVNIDLENGHLLKTSIYWRPSMMNDLKSKLSVVGKAMQRELSEMTSDAARALNMEARYKKQLLASSAPDISPLFAFFAEEADSFQRDAAVISRAFNQMYYRNEFYMKTMDQAFDRFQMTVNDAMLSLAQYARQASVVLAEKWDQLIFQVRLNSFKLAAYANRYVEFFMESAYKGLSIATAQFNAARAVVGEYAADTVNQALARLAVYKQEVVDRTMYLAGEALIAVKPIIEVCKDVYERLTSCMTELKSTMTRNLNILKKKLPMVYMTKKFNQVADLDLLTPVSDLQINIRDNVKGFVGSFSSSVTKMTRKSTRGVAGAVTILNQRLTDFLEHDDTKYAHDLIQEAYNQAKALFEYLDVEKNMMDLSKKTADLIVRVVRKNAFYMVDEYLHLDQDKIVNYDPRQGKLEFQMWVPMNMPNVQMIPMPNMDLLREMYTKTNEFMDQLLPEDFSPLDFYYQHKPKLDTIYPPFEAYAMLSGAQHFMTFDRKFYEFAGSCSYTVARDFVDNTFEILVNFDDNREIARKSMTIRSEGKEVEISSAGLVTIDGAQSELPVAFGAIVMTRQGDLIHLQSAKGFTVSCDIANDMCMLNISGWYYNKVAGLFGTYTNEIYDDMMTSDARVVSDMEEFTRSWISGRCRSVENRARAWDSKSKIACQKLFNNQVSTFRRCYKVVDPAPFLQMCANDVIDDVSNMGEERSSCKAAAMYVMACKKEGVPIRLPRTCVACDKPSYDQFFEGEELTAYAADQSADVIFVVEEKPCNKDALSKLADIASNIDAALKVKGLTNNQFGLIGFGGEGIHDSEHSRTVAGKILGSSKDFSESIMSMSFNEEGDNTDVLKTLRMAAKYPFRAGVAKSVVLLACSECTEQEARYNEIQYNLLNRGISLHVIMEHEFTLGASTDIETPKTNYLFGIDKDTAYTSRHVSDVDLQGDQDLFALISQPPSMCATLAAETDGSFFNINKLTAGRVRFQKHFVDVFARRVAKSAQVPDCQVCECESDGAGSGRSVCKPCGATGDRLDERVLGYAGVVPQQYYQAKPEMEIDFEEYARE